MIVLTLSTPIAQPTDIPYIESWKKGKRKIHEETLEIKLTQQTPKFKAAIKDSNGNTQYEFLVASDIQDKKTDGIDAWNAALLNRRTVFSSLIEDGRVNLLKPANDPFQDSFGWEDMMGHFGPWCVNQHRSEDEACRPNDWFFKKRVIKVEMFYVILQVKDYQLEKGQTSKLYPKLSSLTLNVEFANSYTKTK